MSDLTQKAIFTTHIKDQIIDLKSALAVAEQALLGDNTLTTTDTVELFSRVSNALSWAEVWAEAKEVE